MPRFAFPGVLLGAMITTALPTRAPAQERPAFDLSIANIMRGPEVYGREPQRVRWSADGRWIHFAWNAPGTKWSEPLHSYRVRAAAGSRPERLTEAQADSAGPLFADGSFSRDRRFKAVAHEGDLYLVDTRAATARRLTQTVGTESSPTMTADASGVYFVRDNNIYLLDLARGLTRQITDVRTGPAPRDSTFTGQRAALRSQQQELFDAVRERARLDSLEKKNQREHEALQPRPLYLAQNERVSQLSVSPGGSALLIQTTVPAQAARGTEVPSFVTASGYTEPLRVRTKVGDEQASSRVAFLALTRDGGDVRWLKVVPSDTSRPPSQTFSAGWNDAGTAALVGAVSRDFKTRHLHSVDARGNLTTIETLRDSAWVLAGDAGWLDGSRVWFVSEADGYAHVYTANADGSDKRQITSGKWEVTDVTLSPDRRTFYLTSRESSPFDAHLYRMSAAGGARERITARAGSHATVLSPDGQWIANVHSVANRPPELFLMRNTAGAEMAQLTTSPTAEWLSFPWITPEIVWITASDGVHVPARIYRPKDVGAQPNGAGVIFVHGAGYLHNVHNYWSSYSREYMFHHLLASRGYVVLDIDYRGSAGYGRDWRTAIYRHMGGRDLQDHVDGITLPARASSASHPSASASTAAATADSSRSWRSSPSPSTSARAPRCAASPTGRTTTTRTRARILNTPEDDTLAYRRSSPIYFAEGLEDPLLIAHGMVDVNVHFQDVVRLAQRLIELGKKNWEMAVYPVEDHGFVRPDSWTDEYTRIYKLFERHIGSARETRTSSGAGRQ